MAEVTLYRVGDFYDAFGEDAKVVAEVCGVRLHRCNARDNDSRLIAGFLVSSLSCMDKLEKAGIDVKIVEGLWSWSDVKG